MSIPNVAPHPEDDTRALVNRLWSYCELLRHSGVSTLDYVEQLTYLLFLKMVQERKDWRLNRLNIDDGGFDWASLVDKSGNALADRYTEILSGLGSRPGMIGAIFKGSQSKIQEPAVLEKLVKDLIGKHQWNLTGVDVKGDAYEGLLQRGAEDRKTGAGQYFTPRPLIDAIVECVQPEPSDTIMDPACGTGGFLIAAANYINRHFGNTMTDDEQARLRNRGITGVELVGETARLASMNMLLHDVGLPNGNPVIEVRDSLAKTPARNASIVLANPPFGVGTISGANYSETRQDLWTSTTNKQLNFLQHIFTLLDTDGRAAVVVPDNVLFEGGAGTTIRERLLRTCDVHTLLRLPTGIFYANGVKANVLFFDKRKPAADATPATTKLWVYDFRTNQHFTMKQNPLRREHLDEFVACYLPGEPHANRVESERFKAYTYEDLLARDKVNLDLTFLKDSSLTDLDSLPAPEILVQEIIDDLQAALTEFQAIGETLGLSPDELADNAALTQVEA
ncbi:class I SAM-dependent DNA methyltransferase [Streptomyces sp. BRB081]|uniref:class I SAM-dependent DNA methyltransferase n=1 Tax=Streptomyces sp. BRB081 TaxID=2769544 RepID=UPI001925296B|nr:class I SAM-dependent DNA methyltransferase [Streptomyces sp. BRB081]MBL3805012.1 SAM-dependent DNA methyltransferase [Streptomyces sp. BRB081]